MNQSAFLDTLRRRLAGMPQPEIDDILADYTTHFADGLAAGRNEQDIAKALGDPLRLSRELRAEAGLRRWEASRTPGNFFAVIFGFIALLAVDFVLLLPVLAGFLLFIFVAGTIITAIFIASFNILIKLFQSGDGVAALQMLALSLSGLGLLGFGVGIGALFLLLIDFAVRLLGKFARLHYTLLNKVNLAA